MSSKYAMRSSGLTAEDDVPRKRSKPGLLSHMAKSGDRQFGGKIIDIGNSTMRDLHFQKKNQNFRSAMHTTSLSLLSVSEFLQSFCCMKIFSILANILDALTRICIERQHF